MKITIILLCLVPLLVSCATRPLDAARPQSVTVNKHIAFLNNLDRGEVPYSENQLSRWRMSPDASLIPEPTDFDKLEHVRFLVGANPSRYEVYAVYGTHFFKKQEYNVAVAAYERAEHIVQLEKITNPVDYRKHYASALLFLYVQQREQDIETALDTFGKLVQLDFTIFEHDPRLTMLIALAALDYSNTGRKEEAKDLIIKTRGLVNVPSDITERLEWLYNRMLVE